MKRIVLAATLAALLGTGSCRLYFWAGEHELTLPPESAPTATPTP